MRTEACRRFSPAGLETYLSDPGEAAGIREETGEPVEDGIARFDCVWAATGRRGARYVLYAEGEPISVLAVRSEEKMATVVIVYTTPGERRRGHARMLLERARQEFEEVLHAHETSLSEDGKLWAAKVG